jgi:N-acyl-L-homoserine lactone synthetase
LATTSDGVPLDILVHRLLEQSPFDYRLARDDAERELALRLRGQVVVERGWRSAAELGRRLEQDEYDERALHVLGWDGDVPMSTGRVVLPPGLPTEDACGIVVDPAGQVVDVGRMCVLPAHQGLEHAAFIGLMCRLYLEMRAHGYDVACGMMSAPARTLVRHLGLQIETLGPEREYWNEPRTPVRFSLLSNVQVIQEGTWRGPR